MHSPSPSALTPAPTTPLVTAASPVTQSRNPQALLSELVEQVRNHAQRRAPLRIGGGDSKGFHGPSAPQHPGTLLDMRPYQGVLDYEPSELVLTARSGTPLTQVQALLAEHGQCLPFEPPLFADSATLGGVVASGWSGPARANTGAVRDFVLGVEIINGQGQLLRYGGQVMKNVAGYDVSRLMVGAWGQLGVVTEVSLKVLPLAPAEATLRFELSQSEALAQLHHWGGQPLPLSASTWADGVLTLRLRGAQAAVRSACQQLGGQRWGDITPAGATAHTPAQAFWQACRDQQLPWFAQGTAQQGLWRLSMPQTAPALALPAGLANPLVEWHGGQRWLHAEPEHASALHRLAEQAGGSACLFRPASAAAHQPAPAHGYPLLAPALAGIHQRLRLAFDPHGIFNPGRHPSRCAPG